MYIWICINTQGLSLFKSNSLILQPINFSFLFFFSLDFGVNHWITLKSVKWCVSQLLSDTGQTCTKHSKSILTSISRPGGAEQRFPNILNKHKNYAEIEHVQAVAADISAANEKKKKSVKVTPPMTFLLLSLAVFTTWASATRIQIISNEMNLRTSLIACRLDKLQHFNATADHKFFPFFIYYRTGTCYLRASSLAMQNLDFQNLKRKKWP